MSCPWFLILWYVAWLAGAPRMSQAQATADYLRPMRGYFSSTSPAYYAKVRETLYAGLAAQPLLGTVACPSFSPEYLLCVERKEGKFFLTYRICQTNIWYASEFFTQKPPKSKPIAVTTKTVEVTQPLVDALRQVFSTAIAQTKYPDPTDSRGTDGTTYTFVAYLEGIGAAGGETWSPPADSKMGALVDLVDHLRVLVDTPAAQDQTALTQQAQQLVARLISKK
ncbi:MAG: hypothetical protein EOO60_10820 [Hymenobacter sp.]|nr:MAG: hypothetical protein EOO60_10820 [Hymenobacter sp.]